MENNNPVPPKTKRAPRKKTEMTASNLILIDLIGFALTLLPSVLAINLTGLFVYYTFAKSWLLVLLVAPLVLLASFITIIGLIRLCLPTLKAGKYKREFNKGVLTWYCHFALGRAAKVVGLTRLLQTFNITKYLYWRALGAKVAFNITCSIDLDFTDSPLITIGKGVTIGSETCFSCHVDIGNYLFLTPIVVEDDAFIGMNNLIGPGTILKKGAWIGYGNALDNQTVPEYTKLETIRPTSQQYPQD